MILDLRQSTASLEVEIVDRDGRPVGADHLSLEIAIPSGKPSYAAILSLSDVKPRSVHRFPNLRPMDGFVDVMGRPPKRVPVRLLPNQTTRCRVELGDDSEGGVHRSPASLKDPGGRPGGSAGSGSSAGDSRSGHGRSDPTAARGTGTSEDPASSPRIGKRRHPVRRRFGRPHAHLPSRRQTRRGRRRHRRAVRHGIPHRPRPAGDVERHHQGRPAI